jgi:hypothetical protein
MIIQRLLAVAAFIALTEGVPESNESDASQVSSHRYHRCAYISDIRC